MVQEKDFYYKKNRMAQLRSVCAVFQSNYSVTEAAEKTHIARSALSKQLSSLERDLGTKLFIRTKQKTLEPTQEGILFYKDAIQYVNGIDGLFENFNEKVKDYNNSHLNIAMHQTISTYIFPKILKDMLKEDQFENLEINAYNIPKNEGIKKLLKKEIDLAIYIDSENENFPEEIEKIRMLKNNLYLVCNKNHFLANKKNITLEDLAKCKFIQKNQTTKVYNQIYDRVKTEHSSLHTFSASFENSLELVKYTDYVSTVPELFLQNCSYNFSDISYKNIDHLASKAYFEILLIKNKFFTTPMSYVLDKFKLILNNYNSTVEKGM